MKRIILLWVSILLPVVLAAYQAEVLRGVTVFFSLIVMFVVTWVSGRLFGRIGKTASYPDNAAAFWVAATLNAIITMLYTAAVLVLAEWFYNGFDGLPFRYGPVLLSVTYLCMLMLIVSTRSALSDAWDNGWDRCLQWSIALFSLGVGSACFEEAFKPLGFSYPDLIGSIVILLIAAGGVGMLLSGFVLTLPAHKKHN